MNESNITNAAVCISSGRLEQRKIKEPKGELSPRSESEACKVQSKVHSIISKKREDEIIGWKIGCTTPVTVSYTHLTLPTNREV